MMKYTLFMTSLFFVSFTAMAGTTTSNITKRASASYTNSLDLIPAEKRILDSIPKNESDTQKREYYAKIVRLYRNKEDANAVNKIMLYANKALEGRDLTACVLCDMLNLYAKALLLQAEQSKQANVSVLESRLRLYLEGLALTLEHLKVTDRVPLRGIDRFDSPPGSPLRAKLEKRYEEQVAYAEYAREQNELLTYRDSFLQSIFVLCDPSAFERHDFNNKLRKMGYSEEKAKAICAVLGSAAQKEVENKRAWTASPHNIPPSPTNSALPKPSDVP